jgi:hypothetical protein
MSGIGTGVSMALRAVRVALQRGRGTCALCAQNRKLNSVSLHALLLQYDLSSTTYSPDGKVFQTEYAQKAVDNGR